MPVKTRSMIKKEQEMQQMQQELQQNEPDVYADAKKCMMNVKPWY